MSEAIAGIGHNQGPPDPFEASTAEIDMLYGEAALWLDGEPIRNQEQADALANLLNMFREAAKKADEARKEEVKPFDEAKAEIQAKWAPLIADTTKLKGKAVLAIAELKKVQGVWLEEVDRKLRAEAEAKRKEAEVAQQAAEAAARAAQSLEDKAAAESLIQQAKTAEKVASKAEKTTATASGGFGRAVGLRTSYKPVLTDPVAALSHYWARNQQAVETFLTDLAEHDTRRGIREIPGFVINLIKTAV